MSSRGQAMPVETEVSKAFEVVRKALVEDEGYWISWQANIAMAFYDNFRWAGHDSKLTREELHEVSNKAADYFMKQLTQETK